MNPASDVVRGALHWIQPRFGEKNFELRAAGERVGGLRWERVLGTLATGEFRGRRWTFKRVGFWNPRVTVREEGSPANLGIFHASLWGGGTLDLATRRSFDWKPANTWMTRWTFADEGGHALFVMKEGKEDAKLGDILKTQAIVEIESHGSESGELPLLVLLGWYLFILRQEEVATVAAVT